MTKLKFQRNRGRIKYDLNKETVIWQDIKCGIKLVVKVDGEHIWVQPEKLEGLTTKSK